MVNNFEQHIAINQITLILTIQNIWGDYMRIDGRFKLVFKFLRILL